MVFDDKDDGLIFPTRHGVAQGSAVERQMLSAVGGPDSIRTRLLTNPDGSTTRLKTRGGKPEFVTEGGDEAKVPEGVRPCDHGLYSGGTDNYGERYPGGPTGIFTTGGKLLRSSDGQIVDIKGPKPVWGDAYALGSEMQSGAYGRICSLETGNLTWAFPYNSDTIYVVANAGTISFYSDPSLEAQFHRGTAVVSPDVSDYFSTYPSYPRVHSVADVDSTGKHFILESYGPPLLAASGDDPVAHQNRFRVCRPNHLIAAIECTVVPYNNNGVVYFNVEWRDLVVFTHLYTVPTIVTPAVENVPLRPIQFHTYASQAATTSGSLPSGGTHRKIVKDGATTDAWDSAVDASLLGTDITDYQQNSVEVRINGIRYKNDQLDFVYTKTTEETTTVWELNSTKIIINLTAYYTGGLLTNVVEEVVTPYEQPTAGSYRRCYGERVQVRKVSVEVAESIGGVLAKAEHSITTRSPAYYVHGWGTGGEGSGGWGGWNDKLGPIAGHFTDNFITEDVGNNLVVIRPANKVFGIVTFAGLPIFPSDTADFTTASLSSLLGTNKTKLDVGIVFAGSLKNTSATYTINERSPMEKAIAPFIYASEHPKTKALASGIGSGKSVCWV